MMSEFSEYDLDEDPCIIPPCGQLQAVSSMDGHLEMAKYYEMDGTVCLDIKASSEPYSMNEVKQCPKCRGPLRSMSRYGRLVRRALIDQASKRFILWAHENYLNLMQDFHARQQQLAHSNAAARNQFDKQGSRINLAGSREAQIQSMDAILKKRYQGMVKFRKALDRHLHQVSIDEQPFKRIWDLVQNARRKHATKDEMRWDPDAIQVGESLRVQSLLFRCDLVVFADFLSLASKADLRIDAGKAKRDCVDLIDAAKDAHLPLQETEGLHSARTCQVIFVKLFSAKKLELDK